MATTGGLSNSLQPMPSSRMDGPKMSACITPITGGGLSSSTPGTAEQFALRAAELVGGDRQKSHGDKIENHANIAGLWQAYLDGRARRDGTRDVPLSAGDAAHMMVLLKVARTLAGGHNPDDWIDMAGYSCVAGEIAERRK